jgi:hypothetical protein
MTSAFHQSQTSSPAMMFVLIWRDTLLASLTFLDPLNNNKHAAQ